jgi:hypothetical protein
MYLSTQIEEMAKKKKDVTKSLIKKNYSCGIFQNYDQVEANESTIDSQKQ